MFTVDGNTIKAGVAFTTKTDGRKSFVVIRTHRDDTVSVARETGLIRNPYTKTVSSPTGVKRISVEDFKKNFKKVVESQEDKTTRKLVELEARKKRIEARSADHETALKMDILIEASRGADMESLMERMNALTSDAYDDGYSAAEAMGGYAGDYTDYSENQSGIYAYDQN